MYLIKRLLLIVAVLISWQVFAQEDDLSNDLDVEITDENAHLMPWFGNEQFLIDFLAERGVTYLPPSDDGVEVNTGLPTARVSMRYVVPVHLVIYRNNVGDPASAISRGDAIDVVNDANRRFSEAQAGIHFYVKKVSFVNDNYFRMRVESQVDLVEMFTKHNRSGAITVHVVRQMDRGGYAVHP